MTAEKAKLFFDEYETQLEIAVEKYPQEYAWGFLQPEQVHEVAERMKAAFIRQSYNKEGRAVKAVCKALGIRHTYAAINEFLSNK